MKHLWEVDHPYYCAESNYYAPGREQPCSQHKSWAEFYEEYKDADFDLNLVFRWDWKEEDPETGDSTFNGDVNYRNGKLLVFWMGQRKGLYRWSEIEVCRADEPAVRAWLQKRWDYLAKLWEPLKLS